MATQVSSSNVVSVAEHIIINILLLVRNFVPAHEVCKLILVSMGGHLISHAIMFPSKLNVVIGKYQMLPTIPSTFSWIGYKVLQVLIICFLSGITHNHFLPQRLCPFDPKELLYFNYSALPPSIVMSHNTQLAIPTNPGHFKHFKLIIPMVLLLHPREAFPGHRQFRQTPITPGQTPTSSDQLLIGALRHPSPSQCSGLVPALNGHLGIHPIHDGGKPAISSYQTTTPPSPYSNCFMMIIAFWSYAYYLCMHPISSTSHPRCPDSWN